VLDGTGRDATGRDGTVVTAAAHTRTEEAEGILTVVIDRQDKLNAISPEVTATFWEAVTALEDRDDLRCLVITAAGEYFTSGIDIRVGSGHRRGDPRTQHLHPGWNYRRNYRSHHVLYDEIEAVEKPVILAAQGPCLGAGLEMAVSCDFRFCTPQATFRLPEPALGVIAGSGGSSRLTSLVGPSWAKWLAVAGMEMGAEQAKTIGLVHDIFPADRFLDEVYGFCRRLMSYPPESLGLAKMAVDLAADVDRGTARQVDRLVNTTLIGTPEARNRVRTFLAGRRSRQDRT
jgi:enoyl-CoA hydratase/carnithine racemase